MEPPTKRGKRKLAFTIMIVIFVGWSILIYAYSPVEIIRFIGIKNSYLLMFVLGLIGGTSIFFPLPYYLFEFTLAAGKINPLVLGISTGLGVIAGETTSYLIGYTGREVLSGRMVKFAEKVNIWCSSKHSWLVPIALFFYGIFIPFPNDLIIIPLGVARYPYWKMMIPLGVGNIIFNIALSSAGFYGWSLVF